MILTEVFLGGKTSGGAAAPPAQGRYGMHNYYIGAIGRLSALSALSAAYRPYRPPIGRLSALSAAYRGFARRLHHQYYVLYRL